MKEGLTFKLRGSSLLIKLVLSFLLNLWLSGVLAFLLNLFLAFGTLITMPYGAWIKARYPCLASFWRFRLAVTSDVPSWTENSFRLTGFPPSIRPMPFLS